MLKVIAESCLSCLALPSATATAPNDETWILLNPSAESCERTIRKGVGVHWFSCIVWWKGGRDKNQEMFIVPGQDGAIIELKILVILQLPDLFPRE